MITKEKLTLMKNILKKRGSGCLGRLALTIMAITIRNSKYLYAHLRKRGAIVVIWVMNETSEFKEILNYAPEIDGVMTDCPTKLKEFAYGYDHKND